MRQLTYVSSIAPGAFIDLATILAVSRRNNARDGLSGLLLFDGKRFLQTLEGEAVAVDQTFRRIGQDPRHRAVVILADRNVETPQFGHWAMASEEVGDAGRGALIARIDGLTEGVTDRNMRAQFRSFVRVVRKAA